VANREIDLEVLQSYVREQLQRESEQDKLSSKSTIEGLGDQPDGGGDDNFYIEIANNLVIFDPLDREIPSGDDQATKTEDLKKRILNLPAIETDKIDLQVPLCNCEHEKLAKEFELELRYCSERAQEYMQDAKQLKPVIETNFEDEARVKKLLEIYKFFDDHRLVQNANEQHQYFKSYIEKISTGIRQIKQQIAVQQMLQEQKQKAQAKKLLLYTIPDIFLYRSERSQYP